MQVNNIRDLNMRDALQVKVENNEFLVHLKYEKREPLIENLDLVVNFDKEFRVRMP
jgi:antitoxin component of MazEF toxin-antitoxin module